MPASAGKDPVIELPVTESSAELEALGKLPREQIPLVVAQRGRLVTGRESGSNALSSTDGSRSELPSNSEQASSAWLTAIRAIGLRLPAR